MNIAWAAYIYIQVALSNMNIIVYKEIEGGNNSCVDNVMNELCDK